MKKKDGEKKKEKKYLLVFLGCQDQSNKRLQGSEIDETNCYGFCINNNNNNKWNVSIYITTVFI